MNYVEKIKSELKKETRVGGQLLDLYTLLVLTKGEDCTLEDIHDAWAVWKNGKMPEHRSLVPFDILSVEVQELDRPYMNAVRNAAKRIDYGS